MSPRKVFQRRWQTKILIATLFLGACTSQVITVTSSLTDFPTFTQTPGTSAPLPTQTPRATLSIPATPTVDVTAALGAEFNVPVACLFNYQVSKDGSWIGTDCNVLKELIIVQKDSKKRIVIAYQDILDKSPNVFTVLPLSWSKDNRYFYFTTATICCSSENQYEGNGSLYQYDTERDYWDILVHANHEPYYFFSDDGEHYVYVNQFPEFNIEIGMVEILTKESKRVTLKGFIVDDPRYAWSRDMEKFAIVLWELQLRDGTPGNTLLRIDFEKMDMELVEDFDGSNFPGD